MASSPGLNKVFKINVRYEGRVWYYDIVMIKWYDGECISYEFLRTLTQFPKMTIYDDEQG